MNILCLWGANWQTDAESIADRIPLLLEHVPRIAVEQERGVVWADVRGMAGEQVARRLLSELGEGVRAGIAATPIVAEGAAREGEGEPCVIAGDEEQPFMAGLPLHLLTTDPRLLAMLQGVGIRNCGDLAELSAEAVEVRFGADGSHLRDLARGDDSRILFRPIPPQRPHASVDFVDYSVRDATRLVFTLNALLEQVCDAMLKRARRARRITLTFFLENGEEVAESVRTARPTADRDLWLRRFRTVLEDVQLPDAITGLFLEADALEPLSALQGDLFDRGFSTASFVEEAVGRLLDLYRGIFVRQSASGHPLPEKRTHWTELTPPEAARTASDESQPASSPALQLQLLTRPRPVRVRCRNRRDHSLPVQFHHGNQWHQLTAAGPDRISGGHEESPYAREYYRCVSDQGALLWIYRDAIEDEWFLHGWWD